ncbi:MAG: LysR family transcriptional regulator [Rhodoferax sp.]
MKSRRIHAQTDHLAAMRTFVKVVEAGSFSAVARDMRISTSTVARQVSAIESVLGVSLLHRSTHSVALTEAGQIYHERAVTLIADLDDTHRVVAQLNAEPSGPLKLTAPVAFGRRYLSPLMAPFLALYPDIQIDVRLTDRHNDLVSGGFDLDIHEGENYLENLVVHRLSRNDSVLCASPAYLERRGNPRTPADLEQHNCLRYVHPEGDPRWHLSLGEQRWSTLPTGNLVSDHSELLLDAVSAGLGIAEFEVWLVREQLECGQLVAVLPQYRIDNKLTGHFIYLAYLANRRGSAKVRALRDFLVDKLGHIGQLSDAYIQGLR